MFPSGANPGFYNGVGGGARCMLDHLRCAIYRHTELSENFEFCSQP